MTANDSLRYDITLYVIGLIALLMPPRLFAAQDSDASLLSEGRWVKVHVDSTSVYRIPYTLLKEWEFDRPDKIIVAGYGSVERAHSLDTAPDDLPVLPVSREKDGIYFFAEGDRRITIDPWSYSTQLDTHYNYYSAGSYYFIGERDGMSSPDITVTPDGDTDANALDTHTAVSYTVFRETHPAKHGLLSFSDNITGTAPRTVGYDVTGHEGSATLFSTYAWLHSSPSAQCIGIDFSPEVIKAQNSADRLTKNVKEHVLFSVRENSRSALTLDSECDRFSATFSNPSGVFTTLALTSTTLVYTRANRIGSRPIMMHFKSLPAGERLRIEDARPETALWDVTDPRRPSRLAVTLHDGDVATATVPEQLTAAKLFAYNSTADLPAPVFAGDVVNQNLHALSDVDMLIVTLPATHQAALRLAAAHEKWQGMRVAVVRQTDIFNEFSSGSLHPNGLRTLVRRLCESTGHPLRYLLLFGNGSWDTRSTFDNSGREYMVTYGTEDYAELGHESRLYTSDLYFGTLAPAIPAALSQLHPQPDVSVGRVPTLDAKSAEEFVDKCIAYLSDPTLAGAFNHAIVAGGPGDTNQHISSAEEQAAVISALTPASTIHRAHLSLFALDKPNVISSELYVKYLNLLFAGDSRIFNYSGHSSQEQIAHNALSIAREKGLTYRSMPVVVMTSCNTTPIDRQEASIGKSMILHNPGPIAVIGAGNEVYLKYNAKLHDQYLNLFYSPEGGECLGDVFRLAVSVLNTTTSQSINNLCYNYLGDPALPRYLPTRAATVTRVGEIADITDESQVAVAPMSPVHIAGTVNTPDGEVDTSFSGKMTVCIYDAPHIARTHAHVKGDEILDLTHDEELIHTSVVNVTGGRWEADITLPVTNRTGSNRMTLNAISDGRVLACGGNTILSVDDNIAPAAPSTDTAPPVIRIMLDEAEMPDGCEISPSPVLRVEITDDASGVSLNHAAPGMAPKISIDGASIPGASYLLHPSDVNTASAEYTLSELADGLHTVTVSACDISGNFAEESVNFTVIHRDITASLGVSAGIVRDDVTFTLTHSLPGTPRSTRLVIRDMEGKCVLSSDSVSFPYTWDFTATDGTPVSDGTYRASVCIDAHPYYTSTPETRFTIIKR